MCIKLVPLGLTISNLSIYNLQQIVMINGNEYIENCVEKRSVTISSSMAEGIVFDDWYVPGADMQSVGICALFLLNLGNVFIRKPQVDLDTYSWYMLLAILLVWFMLSYYIYYDEISRISLQWNPVKS